MNQENQNLTREENLEKLVEQYEKSLNHLKLSTTQISFTHILDILTVRDRIQFFLEKDSFIPSLILAKLIQLDDFLKKQANTISEHDLLSNCRQTLQPNQDAWWWFLEQFKTPIKQPKWAEFDWIWNLGTVICLVFATTFVTQTAKAFSTTGFDFLGTLSTISQGAGLVFVAGGALTDKGQKTINRILTSIKIPTYLYAETTFTLAVILLGTSYGIHRNLPSIGDWYYEQGKKLQAKGKISEAQDSYERANNFNPDDPKVSVSIGNLYESTGNFEKAIAEYRKGITKGDPASMNALGRAIIFKNWEKSGWLNKIDENDSRYAESLLERALRINFNQEPPSPFSELLKADIKVNQGLLKWAKIDFINEPKQTEQLNKASVSFHNIFYDYKAINFQDRNSYESWRLLRSQCYRHQQMLIEYTLNKSLLNKDPRLLHREAIFYCWDIYNTTNPLAFYDNKLLRSLHDFLKRDDDGSYQTVYISLFDRNLVKKKEKHKINTITRINELKHKLSALLKENSERVYKLQTKTMIRIFCDTKTNIFKYYTYDKNSSYFANSILTEEFLSTTQKEFSEDSLYDFRVIILPSGKLTITPWSERYNTLNPKNPADLGYLQSLLFQQIDKNVPSSRYEGRVVLFDSERSYLVQITKNGEIVNYEPLTNKDAETVEYTVLPKLLKSNVKDKPIATFKVSFKRSDIFHISLWEEKNES